MVPNTDLTRADPPTGAAMGDSRAQVLAVLQASAGPIGVGEVSSQVGLHTNTARFHLDALVEQGLAQRTSEVRAQPGRPRTLYSATADGVSAGRRSYRLLAEILTSYLASQSDRPAASAVEAGEAWGRFLADRPAPYRRVDEATATERLVAALEEIGFAPEAVGTGSSSTERQILLHHCPFREVAEEHRDIVCGVHLGLMRGVLAEQSAPVAAERLEPFVEPNLCIAHLRTGTKGAGAKGNSGKGAGAKGNSGKGAGTERPGSRPASTARRHAS